MPCDCSSIRACSSLKRITLASSPASPGTSSRIFEGSGMMNPASGSSLWLMCFSFLSGGCAGGPVGKVHLDIQTLIAALDLEAHGVAGVALAQFRQELLRGGEFHS